MIRKREGGTKGERGLGLVGYPLNLVVTPSLSSLRSGDPCKEVV